MLVSSDPLISSLRKECKKKIYELSPEVKSLLDFESEDEESCSNGDTDETGENSDLELDISSPSMQIVCIWIFVKIMNNNNKMCIKIILAC